LQQNVLPFMHKNLLAFEWLRCLAHSFTVQMSNDGKVKKTQSPVGPATAAWETTQPVYIRDASGHIVNKIATDLAATETDFKKRWAADDAADAERRSTKRNRSQSPVRHTIVPAVTAATAAAISANAATPAAISANAAAASVQQQLSSIEQVHADMALVRHEVSVLREENKGLKAALAKLSKCGKCFGAKMTRCVRCDGKGTRSTVSAWGNGQPDTVTCKPCMGSGSDFCRECDGSGYDMRMFRP
jgi:hypothetical protein